MNISKYIIVLSTVPTMEIGETIASYLVEKHLAACVNIIPNITSIYEWKGKVHKDDELILFIKTIRENEQQIFDIIKDIHSYDVPEIISIDINNIDKKYAGWLNSCVNPKSNDK